MDIITKIGTVIPDILYTCEKERNGKKTKKRKKKKQGKKAVKQPTPWTVAHRIDVHIYCHAGPDFPPLPASTDNIVCIQDIGGQDHGE